ncbi:MAG: hypothetical protein IPL61_36120 [Myxococcales bacterium]|nr:hypothetical protein [Myxococcales bacterium]
MRPALVALALVVPAVGCIDRGINRLDPSPDSVEQKLLPVSLNRELDLLFVIDDSSSMELEHMSLETRFPELISRLDTLGGRRPDLHIGVVSSDLGTGRVDTGNPHCTTTGGDGGRLHGAACPALGGATFISDVVGPTGDRVTNYTGSVGAAFACTADVGTDGCGFEQHLASMQAALAEGANPGFLRRSATLGVIILADEDDCSVDDDRLFTPGADPVLGPFSDFRCFEHGVTCDPVADPRAPGVRTGCVARTDSPYLVEIEQYAAFLRDLKDDPDQLFVAAIIGDDDHVEVIPDGNRAALAPGCTGGLGAAAPGIRLGGFLDAVGTASHRETICTGDLSSALAGIIDSLPPLGGACFAAAPADRDPIAPGLQPECAVVEITEPDGPGRAERPLAACAAGVARPCWQIVAAPECTQTDEHWRIDVARDVPGPAGAYLDVQCVVSIPVPPPT